MYQLYIGNKNYSSWSLRPWLLMTELGITFDETLVPFVDGGSFDSYRAFSPTGLVPCLVDGDITVWESLGIVEYLAERHSEVWPSDVAARAWARSATAEMHAGFSALRNECPMSVGVTIALHEQSPALLKDLNRIGELWQDGLKRFGGPFLAGDRFTAVDAFYAPVVFRLNTYQLQVADEAKIYADSISRLDSMQRWYKAGCEEHWRESDHEEEFKLLGECLEDRRAK